MRFLSSSYSSNGYMVIVVVVIVAVVMPLLIKAMLIIYSLHFDWNSHVLHLLSSSFIYVSPNQWFSYVSFWGNGELMKHLWIAFLLFVGTLFVSSHNITSVSLYWRYQALMKESSKLPLFDLRKLNAALPVPSVPDNTTEILVVGASNDFIVVSESSLTSQMHSML